MQATDGNSYTMKGGEFEFTLTPGDNNPSSDPLKGGASVKNDAEGNVVFADKLTYTEPGDYEYTLTEETTSLGGMTYDASVYKVVVKVTDNQKTGKLEADVTITKDGKDANDIDRTDKSDRWYV